MKPMDSEKVAKCLSFLIEEVKDKWNERALLRSKGKDDLAYHCKMKASRTELIRAVFLKLVNDELMEITEQDLVRTS
ncbi:MAG: hypothetical protein OEW15_11430 [Nitrospirota bacterium]|nr:hypothetical protein [Nitrospirota bacterium]